MNDISAALEAIKKSVSSFDEEKAEAIKGDRGPIGPPGRDGKDGRDGAPAPLPKIKVGRVETGDEAKASVRETDGIFIFDFVLPRGDRGPIGKTGNSGIDGATGPKGDTIKGDRGPRGDTGATPRIRIGTVSVGEAASVAVNQSEDGSVAILNFVLPKAKDGEPGTAGTPGVDGMSADEIHQFVAQTIIEVLQDVGVSNAHVARLVAVRAALKKKINQANARHIGEISDLVGQVDRLFDQD